VRVDLKGFGFSSKPQDEHYTPYDQALLLSKALKQLSLTNVVLVGHSLGGGIALITCIESLTAHDDLRIKGLVLIDSVWYPQKLPLYVSVLRNPVAGFLSTLAPSDFKVRYLLIHILYVKERVTPEMVHRYAYFLHQPGSHYALTKTAQQVLPDNVSELVPKISQVSIPTLVIWGENDTVIPVESGRRFHQDIPKSQLLVLTETGHLPHEERPAEVYAAIDNFIRSLA